MWIARPRNNRSGTNKKILNEQGYDVSGAEIANKNMDR